MSRITYHNTPRGSIVYAFSDEDQTAFYVKIDEWVEPDYAVGKVYYEAKPDGVDAYIGSEHMVKILTEVDFDRAQSSGFPVIAA